MRKKMMANNFTLPITGNCLCKKVNFSISAHPKRIGLCHCKSCQIKSGSDHIAYMAVEKNAVDIKGTVKWFDAIGDSGEAKQHGFCPECGTNLFGKPTHWPHILVVYLGALHQSEQFKPEVNIWMSDALPWESIDNSLEKFDRNPA